MAKIPEGSALHTCILPNDLWQAARERTRTDGHHPLGARLIHGPPGGRLPWIAHAADGEAGLEPRAVCVEDRERHPRYGDPAGDPGGPAALRQLVGGLVARRLCVARATWSSTGPVNALACADPD